MNIAERHRAAQKKYRELHPEADRLSRQSAKARYNERHPDRIKSYHLKRKFNMTLAAWEALFESQGRACGCCGATEPGWSKGWQTDHCHFSGKIRAILCGACNRTLSKHFQLNASKFIAFLDKHSGLIA